MRTLLETLKEPDFSKLSVPNVDPANPSRVATQERRLPGVVCVSDPNATSGLFRAPNSYRATTGPAPDGGDGAFAPGRLTRISDIDAGDGLSYTAAFSERLVGDRRPHAALSNYANVPGPLTDRSGCPTAPESAWKGDAGASWYVADWRATLYNHALTPNARPSCIADDGETAFIGASSGHPGGVNVLTFDGSAKFHSQTIDPNIWRALSTPNAPGPSPRVP